MTSLIPIALGAATSSAIVARERKTKQQAERLAAALLETLLNAIDANDPQTGAHVRRVARYALILADAADLSPTEQRKVERVALFHDIGKIHEALFDIIHEDTKLTPQERRAIATHPQRGFEVLQPLCAFYPDLPAGVLAHHERWDGMGYPNRLRGTNIPLAARIVAIADSFDAITHRRRYHSGKSSAFAAQVIATGSGAQFDPDLADLFLCPPVFACIEHARARPDRAPQVRSDRRGERKLPAPDVTFRWRDTGPEGDDRPAPRRR